MKNFYNIIFTWLIVIKIQIYFFSQIILFDLCKLIVYIIYKWNILSQKFWKCALKISFYEFIKEKYIKEKNVHENAEKVN